MTKTLLIACALFALAACTPRAGGEVSNGSYARNAPSATEPGVHFSGKAEFGVVKNF